MSSNITFEEWADLLQACNMAELEGGAAASYDVLDKLRAHYGLPPLYRGTLHVVNAWELDDDHDHILATCPKGHEHVMNTNIFIPQVEGAVAILDDCPCEESWVVHLPDTTGHPGRTACGQVWERLVPYRKDQQSSPYLGHLGRRYSREKEHVSCTECLKTIQSSSTTSP